MIQRKKYFLGVAIMLMPLRLFPADMKFASKSASIVLNGTNSQLRIGKVAKVKGWSEQSIVKNVVYNSAANWVENYQDGSVIGSSGLTPATDLLNSTSQAIKYYAPMIRNNSYLLRSTSNAVNQYAPVAGNINLSNTSLQLSGDKTLTSKAYLTSGGTINGNGYTLKLTSSFVIPANKNLKISGNIVIDGQGNNFVVGPNAQFIVDPTVSVTLRNLNWFNSNSEPHLQMRSDTSRLTLDAINTNFDRNFSFTQGRLYIENEVMVTGTNKFSYSSHQPMYIEPFSTLRFDVGSTFSYSPINRNLVQLVDRTSQLYLNNCTVDMPNGMQLTRGTIIFDNRVVMNGDLELGDGISSVNNVAVDVLSAADIVRNGTIYYNPAA